MANTPEENFENPFESPQGEAAQAPAERPIQGRRAQASSFIHLAFQFKFVGGILLLFGLLLATAVVWLGALLLAGGLAFIVTGYAIGSYKPWGWYAGAVLVVPLLLIASALSLLFVVSQQNVFALVAVVITPLYCYYIAWTLFSRAGRQRYDETVHALASARANPDSIAGQMYRKRR